MFETAIELLDPQELQSSTRYALVETGGDWMAIYDRVGGECLWQGHPSDKDPLDFLQLLDRLDISAAQIDRTYYRSSSIDPERGNSRLPQRLADVVLD